VSNDPTFALHQRSKRTREARSVQEHCGAVADTPMGVALKETQDQGPNVDTLRCRKPPYMLEPVLASGSHVPRKTREPSGPAPVVERSLLPSPMVGKPLESEGLAPEAELPLAPILVPTVPTSTLEQVLTSTAQSGHHACPTASAQRRKRRLMKQAALAAAGSSKEEPPNEIAAPDQGPLLESPCGSRSPSVQPLASDVRVIDGRSGVSIDAASVDVAPLPSVEELTTLEKLSMSEFAQDLKSKAIAEVVIILPKTELLELNSSSVIDETVLTEFRQKFDARRGSAILKNPKDRYYRIVKQFADTCLSRNPPAGLPPDRGVRHEIELVPGSGYALLRQWALPTEQSEFIDDFFAKKHKNGLVRESKSPHSAPTFCVRKPNGKWRIVHAFNKLNAMTVPAQTPIPRKDTIIHRMAGAKKMSSLDLVDGY